MDTDHPSVYVPVDGNRCMAFSKSCADSIPSQPESVYLLMLLPTNVSSRYQPSPCQRHEYPKYALALIASVALHTAIWQIGHKMDAPLPPVIKPPATIEVVMVSKPKLLEPAPAPPVVTPAPPPPRPAPPPVKTPPPPKPKPETLPRKTPVPKKQAVTTETQPIPVPVQSLTAPAVSTSDSMAAPAPQPVTRVESKAETFTEARADAGYLNNPRPDYPAMAKRRFLEGKVILKVEVLASGQPGRINVEISSGHSILDESAQETVQHWRFVPAKRGDKAVDSWVKVPIVFKLSN